SIFTPSEPADHPAEFFDSEHRWIRKTNPRQILISADGACSGNGQGNAKGGCSFVYHPSAYNEAGESTHKGTVSFRLERDLMVRSTSKPIIMRCYAR
ncbi:hypothetical protein B0J14DRAFT_210248, partial [Halenospora varia]